MFATVLRIRKLGALIPGDHPPMEQWERGIFEFSTAERQGRGARRLVLRSPMANPDKGVIFELFEPRLVGISDRPHPHFRLRGVEEVMLAGDQPSAVVQEWLVCKIG